MSIKVPYNKEYIMFIQYIRVKKDNNNIESIYGKN